jgi:hypothetical protein
MGDITLAQIETAREHGIIIPDLAATPTNDAGLGHPPRAPYSCMKPVEAVSLLGLSSR